MLAGYSAISWLWVVPMVMSDVGARGLIGTALALVFIGGVGAVIWGLSRSPSSAPSTDRQTAVRTLGIALTLGLVVITSGQILGRLVGLPAAGGPILGAIVVFLGLTRRNAVLEVWRSLGTEVLAAACVATAAVSIAFAMTGRPTMWVVALLATLSTVAGKASRPRNIRLASLPLLVAAATWYAVALTSQSNFDAPYPLVTSAESIPDVAWGNSLYDLGPSDNIILAGTAIRHHWMGALMQANLGRLAGLAPEALQLSAAWAVLATAATAWVVYAAAGVVTRSHMASLVAVIVTFAAASIDGPWLVVAESDITATGYMAIYLVMVVVFLERGRIRYAGPLLAVLAPFAVLNNGPAGVVVVVGTSAVLLATWRREAVEAGRGRTAAVVIGPIVTAMLTYLLFMSPNSDSTRMIELAWSSVKSPQSVALVIALPTIRLLQPWLGRSVRSRPVRDLATTFALLSLASFFVLRNSSGLITDYFALPGLLIFGISIVPLVVTVWGPPTERCRRWRAGCVIAVVQGAVIGCVGSLAFNVVQHAGLRLERWQRIASWLPLVAPVIAVIGATGVALVARDRGRQKRTAAQSGPALVILALAGMSVGVGVGHSLRGQARSLIDARHGVADVAPGRPIVDRDLLTALRSLGEASAAGDLVATNYLLGDDADDFFIGGANVGPERSLTGAIGAIARRRTLVEGDAWAHVGRIYPARSTRSIEEVSPGILVTSHVPAPVWLKARIEASQRFGRDADPSAARYLSEMGVSWFVVDLRDSRLSAEQWALVDGVRVVYDSTDTLVLDLRLKATP